MKIIRTVAEMQEYRNSIAGQTVGFVPTMGALHKGHATLIETSIGKCDKTILSIFVNPTQFNDPNDFKKYPNTLDADLSLAQSLKVDAVFCPNAEEMYPDKYTYQISETSFSNKLCGAHRPGHFTGVLTVVMKLFQIARPDTAFFGEKDFQQLQLIKNMCQAFFLPIQIHPVKTLRELDGLAMSSRNVRLSEEERKLAPAIFQIAKNSNSADSTAQKLTELGFHVDYVEDIDSRRFIAASIGSVRLIDNVEI